MSKRITKAEGERIALAYLEQRAKDDAARAEYMRRLRERGPRRGPSILMAAAIMGAARMT